MSSYNYVNFAGHLTQAPIFTGVNEDGTPHKNDRCWCVLAHNPPTKKKVDPVFMAIVAWGRNAELLRDHGSKGKGWGVEGRLKTRTKELADGTKYTYAEIVVSRHEMGLPSRKDKAAWAKIIEGVQNAPAEEEAKPNLKDIMQRFADAGLTEDEVKALLSEAQSATDKAADGNDPF